MTPTLSVIIASQGRPTLPRTVFSAFNQTCKGDEVLVSVNSDSKWGHSARNQLMQQARGDYLLFTDDDDIVTDGALDVIRAAVADDPDGKPHLHIFRMVYAQHGGILWQVPRVECGNVSTQMCVVPRVVKHMADCRWREGVYEGDYHFIAACAEHFPVRWHEDVIAEIRPQ